MNDELLNLLAGEEIPGPKVTRELGWFVVGKLPLPSGRLWIGDPGFSWAELNDGDYGQVDLPPGEYYVLAYVVEMEKANVIARLRVSLTNDADLERGAAIATAGTDSAAIGVCDGAELWKAFQDRFGDDEDSPVEFLEDFPFEPCGYLRPNGDQGAALIYIGTGSDGGGPVFELLKQGERVGVEIPFVE
jgi:hypothetical protein